MSLGLIALLVAFVAAGWLLLRVARGGAADDNRAVTVLKIVIWLGLSAVLVAAKLWPLAFMVLLAAGGVMAIEMWRAGAVRADEAHARAAEPVTAQKMSADEAAALLGVTKDAPADAIRSAHKKLIAQIHPDKGGTDYLAAKINEARDLLLAQDTGTD
ncbi:MAG: J domain-containing protein [Hyphococcus sp.]